MSGEDANALLEEVQRLGARVARVERALLAALSVLSEPVRELGPEGRAEVERAAAEIAARAQGRAGAEGPREATRR